MEIDSIILDQRLHIDASLEDVAALFCNTAGAATNITKNRFLLSNWYEGYLYCLLLGMKIGEREPYRKGQKIDKTPKWSKSYIVQYKYAVANLLCKKDILIELNLTSRKSIETNYKGVDSLMDKIKKICDEYSNGGLLYLKNKFDQDDTIFNDYSSLKRIYYEANTE
jgi:hypothetical protein